MRWSLTPETSGEFDLFCPLSTSLSLTLSRSLSLSFVSLSLNLWRVVACRGGNRLFLGAPEWEQVIPGGAGGGNRLFLGAPLCFSCSSASDLSRLPRLLVFVPFWCPERLPADDPHLTNPRSIEVFISTFLPSSPRRRSISLTRSSVLLLFHPTF